MANSVFTIKFIRAKNGFLYLPEGYARKLQNLGFLTDDSVIKVEKQCQQDGTSLAYFSWRVMKMQDDCVGINATCATKLGFREDEHVVVDCLSQVMSVQRANVTALSEDDLDIIAQNAISLQSSLLSQVRVVWPGQLLTIWITDAFPIILQVDSLEPNIAVGRLEVLTDVVIGSPSNNGQLPTMSRSSDEQNSGSAHLGNGASPSSHSVFQHEESITMPRWLQSMWSFLKVPIHSKECGKSNLKYTAHPHFVGKQNVIVPKMFRVCPFEENLSTHNSCHVLIFEKDMESLKMNKANLKGLYKITKVPSPSELSKRKTTLSKPEVTESQPTMPSNVLNVSNDKSSSLVVRVKTVESLEGSKIDFLWSPQKCVFVPLNVRRCLGLDIGSRVKLFSVESKDQRVKLDRVELLPSTNQGVDGVALKRSFERCVHSTPEGLLLSSGLQITLPCINGDVDVQIKLFPKALKFVLMTNDLLKETEVSLTLAGPTEMQKSRDEQNNEVKFLHLSHVEPLMDDALISLALTLGLNEIYENAEQSNFVKDNVLLTGKRGSGKSSFVRALCHNLGGPPHHVYSTVIMCRPLKGKKVETLFKVLQGQLAECVYHQPAILVLDDIESIASMALEQEQEYFNRVGKMLLNLLQEVQSMHSVVVVGTAVASSQLCSPLISARGTHFFNTMLELPELSKADRQGVIEKLLLERLETKQLRSIACHAAVPDSASKTEGYTCQDLSDVVDRAVFGAWSRLGTSIKKPELESCDLLEAVSESTPMQLHGVSLHKDLTNSWADVGGLSSVKNVLVEVLQWPVMYPELFQDSPLRHQSGLLLYGAPGTGKTMLAGAVARECGLNFISVKGPELLSKYIGASEEAVRNIFQKAQSAKPCVLFFDEFDSLAPRRGHDSTGVTDRVVNQLLTQLDGVESLIGVWVMAATSRPDLLDPALLRPGRLDRSALCPLPNEVDRLEILETLSRRLRLCSDVDFPSIATQTEYFTGADLQAVLYTAQLTAVEEYQNECKKATDKSDSELKVVLVKQKHLEASLKSTRPSLSKPERLRYQRIYERFARSGQGDFSEDMAGTAQRATLA